jgi:hypothetical protein
LDRDKDHYIERDNDPHDEVGMPSRHLALPSVREREFPAISHPIGHEDSKNGDLQHALDEQDQTQPRVLSEYAKQHCNRRNH